MMKLDFVEMGMFNIIMYNLVVCPWLTQNYIKGLQRNVLFSHLLNDERSIIKWHSQFETVPAGPTCSFRN